MSASSCVVYITAPAGRASKKIADKLLQTRSAACVNIVPQVHSVYWWKGKLERDKESLLIVKTTRKRLKKLIQTVRSVHPYTLPEIIALPIIAGHKPYLDWVRRETK